MVQVKLLIFHRIINNIIIIMRKLRHVQEVFILCKILHKYMYRLSSIQYIANEIMRRIIILLYVGLDN